MGLFKIRYIGREGHGEVDTVVARTKRLARLQAKAEHDDVISVKRSPVRWGRILLYFLIAACVVALVKFA